MTNNNMLNTATIPITVAEGGSGVASNTAYATLCGGTSSTSAIQSVAALGTSGQCLTSNGASALPTFKTKDTYIVGTTTNDSAAAGNLGEVIYSEVVFGSGVSLTTNVAKTVTSISLTAGDWDIYGNIIFFPSGTHTASVTRLSGGISLSTNTMPTLSDPTLSAGSVVISATVPGDALIYVNICPCRQSLSGNTTVYLIALATFTVNTLTAGGFITARRAR